MIFIRQDRPGFITVDFSEEPNFDRDLHDGELRLGLFTVEGGPREIVAEDNGQLGQILGYICSFLSERGFQTELDHSLRQALSRFQQETTLVEAARLKLPKRRTLTSLRKYGITRRLLPHQKKAVLHALSIQHAANFSVPGSGKTTSALSVHGVLLHDRVVDRLMVIGPASSFQPWEDEFRATFGREPSTLRLVGTARQRERLLQHLEGVDLVLCTYQMAFRERENLISALRGAQYFLILDEAHHVKNINLGPWARTALDLAPYAVRRMILTGTPAPRSLSDLWSQFTFLWPSQNVLGNRAQFEQLLASPSVAETKLKRILKPFFTRTKKSDLGLPKPRSIFKRIPYRNTPPRQKVIIRLLEQRTLHEAKALGMSQADLSILRSWRKARTLRLLQAASNPALLASAIPDVGDFGGPMDDDPALAVLLRNYLDNETPAKIGFVVGEVRRLVSEGQKVLVWATFVQNILLLERLLADLHPLKIYGDVPPYNEDDDPNFENRERNILEFKTRADRPVLIANPAACSESVSLHKVCHHAIYLERTFNCGQFLQSMDRIHRVGMDPGLHPCYHIPLLECAIEQVVDRRLKSRQLVLYRLLDDDMPVLGMDDDSFLSDREDDLESIFQELLREFSSHGKKRSSGTSRRDRAHRRDS